MASVDPFDDVLKELGMDQDVQNIRSMNFVMILNGTVQVVAGVNGINVYTTRYRIPTYTIRDLPLWERVWRAEKFALGTLLYEILTSHKPFEWLDDDEVQGHYAAAHFPQDLESVQPLCFQSLIYACWSAEFARYLTLNKFRRYVADNPWCFGLQATGVAATTVALITVPVLGWVGFSSLGPVAGSAAAAWQASIGAVEAGSLFAICQSAAMGGAAATAALATTATTGVGVTMAASTLPGASDLRDTFKEKFRRGPEN